MLVVGAGPTGLVLAAYLAHQGVKARIIEKNGGPGQASRAMVVQARTLELYDQIGFAEHVIARGIKTSQFHLWESGKEAAVFDLGGFGSGISPFNFVLSLPQDEHEKLLGQHLASLGVQVEWNTELLGFEQEPDGCRYTLRSASGLQTGLCQYLCGCDGAHSRVRETLGLTFPGGTYEQIMFVADVEAAGAVVNNAVNACLNAHDFMLAFPIRTSGALRLIGLLPNEIRSQGVAEFSPIAPFVEQIFGIKISRTNWSSIYHVHHRVADKFRSANAFLLGDAGHIHSPAGGQGMNTGIGDAVNLAWKLAEVVRGKGEEALLDTYESERIRFARALVESTDRLFQLASSSGFSSVMFRTVFPPHIAPTALHVDAVKKGAFRLVSQTKIEYRPSPLSEGSTGEVDAGDRLPWIQELDNYKPLRWMDWQMHVYGSATLKDVGVPLHEFTWCPGAHDAGFARDAMYLIRPDGYIGLASANQDEGVLKSYLQKWGLT